MGTEVEQGSDRNAPRELQPLAKLGWQIRLNKYKPTSQEMELLQKCFDDGKWYYLNGALVSGGVVWNLTGMGKKVKFFPRIIMTAAAAVVGRNIAGQFAANRCMKRILTLEGSPLRGELIAILQEDYPNHPLLRTTLGQHDGSSTAKLGLELEDYAQEAHVPVSSMDPVLEMDDSASPNWAEVLGRGAGDGQKRSQRIPRIWERSDEKKDMKKDFDGADILADPFDLAMQTGLVDEVDDAGGQEQTQTERRRSHMSAKERREHDRRQYEQRREQHSY